MNHKNQKALPISCICSIYKGTILKEFIISIDSLLVQDYIPNEIVIIVDGIINKDIEYFLNSILKFETILKVYYIDQNMGLGLALKYGLPKCRNEIVARFDSDDINLKNRLKIQYDLLKEKPEISIVGSDILEFNRYEKKVFIKQMENNNISENFMIRNPLNHPSVMYRKKDIINVGSYKDIKFFEDYELWLRCIKKGVGICNINKALVAMRRSSYLTNRIGLRYAFLELKFLVEAIRQNTIKKIYIPFFIIRIIIRLLPKNFTFLIKFFDSRRLVFEEEFNLKDYILKVTNDRNSYNKKYNKFISN